VQGHVDATATLVSLVPLRPDIDTTDWRMTLELPPHLAAQIIPQGSITVDGISLTVARVHPLTETGHIRIEIAVIPHTYKSTNLRSHMAGDQLNIETDVLSKYAAQQLAATAEPATATLATSLDQLEATEPVHRTPASEWLTAEYLLANGY
jgi:riboflavin synthase